MIPKVTHGTDVRRLLWYLFGPGYHNEHTNQHVVAGYEDPVNLEPDRDEAERVDVRPLAAKLMAPVDRARELGLRVPEAWVWHCSLSLRADEGQLPDETWRQIATDFVREMGFISADPAEDGCRWVAVRHGLSVNGNDHVHIVVTLVTEEGRVPSVWQDKRRSQQAARRLERRYGLAEVAVRDAAYTRPGVSRGEIAAAVRRGRGVPDRAWLRQQVRLAATAARSEAEFVARMRAAGLLIRVRVDKDDPTRVTGYAVAVPTHGDGEPVWYGGGRLDGGLSLPRLRQRWAGTEITAEEWELTPPAAAVDRLPPEQSTRVWKAAAQQIGEIAQRAQKVAHSPEDAHAIASGAAELLTGLAGVAEPTRYESLAKAADALDRAATPPRGFVAQRPSPLARSLADGMRMTRMLIAATAPPRERQQILATIMVIENLMRVIEAIVRMHQASGREAAAGAARTARSHLAPLVEAAAPLTRNQAGRESQVMQRTISRAPVVERRTRDIEQFR